MNKALNILVTGCGGDIGQSIGKILSKSSYTKNLFGIDISDKFRIILQKIIDFKYYVTFL